MSIGHGAKCRIIAKNETEVVYEYACYNLNNDEHELAKESYSGLITIKKKAFFEPEIREKIKRFPNGKKKKLIKRIHKNVDFDILIREKQIIIKNSDFCWLKYLDVDIMARKLITKLFDEYQDNSIIPDSSTLYY